MNMKIKVYCAVCKKELEVYPYRLKKTKNFYCKDHIKEAWEKYSKLGRIYGPRTISKLAKEGKLPLGTLKSLEKGRYKGKKHSEETKQKLKIAGKNRVLSSEAKEKMIEGSRKSGLKSKGKKLSVETRKKISLIQGGDGIIGNGYQKQLMYNRKRRIRKLQAGGSHTLLEWDNLKLFYNYMCLCCKKFEPEIILTEDHIIPLIMGGSDNIENIQLLCRSCNTRKFTKTIDYRNFFMKGGEKNIISFLTN